MLKRIVIAAMAVVFLVVGSNNLALAVNVPSQTANFVLKNPSEMHARILAHKIVKELNIEKEVTFNVGQMLNLARKDQVMFNIMVDALIYLAGEAKAADQLVNFINSLAKDYKNNITIPFKKVDYFHLPVGTNFNYLKPQKFIEYHSKDRTFLYEDIKSALSYKTSSAMKFKETRYLNALKMIDALLAAGTFL